MRVVHRLIVGSLVHRLGSKERCQKRDLWMMSALEESRGHYVTKIAKSLRYLMNREVEKCSEPIECEKLTTKMLANELDLDNQTLLRSTLLPHPPRVASEQRQEPSGLNLSWGDWNANLNEIERSMTKFGGTTIVPSSGYEIEGSSRAMQEDDVDDSMSEQRVHTDDDMGSKED
ncbi:hypothetical protein Tco_0502055 [Tanacetum coccineum]